MQQTFQRQSSFKAETETKIDDKIGVEDNDKINVEEDSKMDVDELKEKAKVSMDIVFILDYSGSMHGKEGMTSEGFNDVIRKQKDFYEKENLSITCTVTMVTFSNFSKISIVYEKKNIFEVELMRKEDIQPDGMTALYDAMGEAFKIVFENGRKRTYVIITDGEENDSNEYNKTSIKEIIDRFDKENISVLYIGSNQDSISAGNSIGLDRNRSLNYTDEKTPQAWESASRALTRVITGHTPSAVFLEEDRLVLEGGRLSLREEEIFQQLQNSVYEIPATPILRRNVR